MKKRHTAEQIVAKIREAEVNEPMAEDGLQSAQQSVTKGVPLGDQAWKARIAKRPGLHITLRPRGRPCRDGHNLS